MQKIISVVSPYSTAEPAVVEAVAPNGESVIVQIKSYTGVGGFGNKIKIASDWHTKRDEEEKELPRVPLEEVVSHIGIGGRFNTRRPSIEADKDALREAKKIDDEIERRFRETQKAARRRSSGIGGAGNALVSPDWKPVDGEEAGLMRFMSRRRSSVVSTSTSGAEDNRTLARFLSSSSRRRSSAVSLSSS